MRRFLITLILPLFPATMAAGQFIDTPKNNAGDAPPRPAQAGQEGGPRGRGMMGPPNMMFSVIDADSDGKITARELRRAAVQLKKLDLDRDGNITLVGAPPKALAVSAFGLTLGRRSLSGSPIGSIAETQEMLDFCGKHNITADVEVIPIQKVNEAYERLLKSDVKYRFSVDMASLKSE